MDLTFENVKAIARAIPIDDEVLRRGYQLKRKGSQLEGPCPVCGGTDRFFVTPKKNVWGCRHCEKGGDVISLVQHVEGINFIDAVEMLSGERLRNVDADKIRRMTAEAERKRAAQEEADRRYAEEQYKVAMRIWDDAVCIWDTPAQKYLESRCCDGMFPYDRDQVLRYHPHCPLGRGTTHPSLIALIRNIETDEPQGIQHTALTPDGQKIERRTMARQKGGAIKLWPQNPVKDHLTVGEGMETVLSTALHVKRPYPLTPAWSLMSAGNLEDMPIVPGVNNLVILVDNDENGKGQNAATALEKSFLKDHPERNVWRLMPPKAGTDMNDFVIEQRNKFRA